MPIAGVKAWAACQRRFDKKIGGVGPLRDVRHGELKLGDEFEPVGLVIAECPLLLKPLQTYVVRVQLK